MFSGTKSVITVLHRVQWHKIINLPSCIVIGLKSILFCIVIGLKSIQFCIITGTKSIITILHHHLHRNRLLLSCTLFTGTKSVITILHHHWHKICNLPSCTTTDTQSVIYEGCPKSLASYFFKNQKMMLQRYPAVVI